MSKQLPSYVGLLVLFVLSFLVLHWIYGHVVVIQSETNDGFFMFGRHFLLEFLDHPGDLLRYAGRFLSQFYHYQWLGALIVSACIACLGVLFHRILVKLNGTAHVSQTLLPCLFLLALHTSTIYVIYDTLGLCASCGVFWGYVSLRGKVARWAYALVATPVLYLLLGVYAWLFVAWIVALAWLDAPFRSGLVFKILYLVFSIAVPLVAWRWVFSIPLRSALTCPIVFGPPFRTGSPPYTFVHVATDFLLMVGLFVSLLVIPFWGRFSCSARLATFWRVAPRGWKRVGLVVALPVAALTFHFIRYDGAMSSLVACRRLYKLEQWDALLEQARRDSYRDPRVQFMTNFALCRKRRLLDEMFGYAQVWGPRGLVFNFFDVDASPAEDDSYRAMYNSDLFYEMGHINASFRHVYDYLWIREMSYDALKRMAFCSMVNGNYPMAAKYLNLLESTTFHRGFARRYKAILADPGAAEREFRDRRRRLPVVEGFMRGHPAKPFLQLLESKSDNPMAFDYLMAWILLDKSSIVDIPRIIDQFETAGYTSLPIHCQEALLLLERLRGEAVDLQGFRYDEATAARVEGFFRHASRLQGQEDADLQLEVLYGDTYMFYYFFLGPPPDAGRQTPRGSRGVSRDE